MPSLRDKVAVVTGSTSGIGLGIAEHFRELGARLVIHGLEQRAAEGIAERLRARGHDVAAVGGDLREPDTCRRIVRFATEWAGGVDVLVNNAGILGVPFGTSVDGFELQFGTNHLGHFALTNLLLPQLTDRVVVVGSQSHRGGDLDLDDLDWKRRSYRPYAAYEASKLANLLFLAELQRRLTAAGSRLRATGAHPGSTATAITGNTGSAVKTWIGSFGHRLVGMPAWRGALTTVYAATMDVPGNTYIGPHGMREMQGWPVSVGRSRQASDPDLAKGLWAKSEELTGVRFPL